MIRKALVELTGGLCGAHCTAGHGDGRSRLEIFDFVREMCWKMLETIKHHHIYQKWMVFQDS